LVRYFRPILHPQPDKPKRQQPAQLGAAFCWGHLVGREWVGSFHVSGCRDWWCRYQSKATLVRRSGHLAKTANLSGSTSTFGCFDLVLFAKFARLWVSKTSYSRESGGSEWQGHYFEERQSFRAYLLNPRLIW